jgi:hypothetical protein
MAEYVDGANVFWFSDACGLECAVHDLPDPGGAHGKDFLVGLDSLAIGKGLQPGSQGRGDGNLGNFVALTFDSGNPTEGSLAQALGCQANGFAHSEATIEDSLNQQRVSFALATSGMAFCFSSQLPHFVNAEMGNEV